MRAMVRRTVTLLVVLAAMPAWASTVRLQVTGDTCDFASLEPQLAQMLGADPVDANARAIVEIDVSNAHDAFEARVLFDDGDGLVRGPRVVTAASCNELVKSVAVVIATALPDVQEDSEAATVVVDEPPRASTPAPVALTFDFEPATDLDVTPLASEPSVSQTDVFVAGATGITSAGADGQAIVGIRVRRNAASVGAELRGDAPQQVSADRMGTIGIARAQISISPCTHFGAFATCVVVGAGTIHGSGAGLTSAREAYTPLLTAGLRVTWEQPLTRRLALRIHFDADALLTTTQFDVDDMKVWESQRFEASAGLGVLAHFP
jgi:hypothetical protein